IDELEENGNSMGIQDLQPQISLNALTRTNNFQTMRVIDTVGKHLVHILVDCGSTHNFLDKNMAKKLGYSIRPTGPLAVTVADGNNLVTTSECRNFKWQFDNTIFTTDIVLLPLGGCELVLGIQWLAILGDIKCNFKELRLEFKYEGKKVQLRGTHKFNVVWLSDKKSENNARQVAQGEFHSIALTVYLMNAISCFNLEGMPMKVDEKIKVVLKNYEDVFGILVELPLQRQLNKQTMKDKFPIPIIEELIDELHGSKLFTKLDLRSGYHQIRMDEADVAKIDFRTHEGHYEFLVMPFGLTTAPSKFYQCLEEHIIHLQTILETMRAHKLFAKLSKCVFGAAQVEYLGHVISTQGVATDPAKIEAKEKLARAYEWNSAAQAAFEALKQAMISALVLKLPDLTKEFTVENRCFWRRYWGSFISRGSSNSILSKTLSAKHQLMSNYEKEFLAVVLALEKWRGYLLGKHFKIKTDHISLKYLMDQRMSTPTQLKWLPKLMGFGFAIVYKKGVDNVTIDALSKLHNPAALLSIIGTTIVTTDLYRRIQLRRKGKLMVRNNEAARIELLQQVHRGASGGHSRVKRIREVTYKLDLPGTSQIHNVFHVSRLRKCRHLTPDQTSGTLPPCHSSGVFLVEPMAILDIRMAKKGNGMDIYVLVQWTNEIIEDAT
nr:hypothetical protein [Tanacetum cinerariifolium]